MLLIQFVKFSKGFGIWSIEFLFESLVCEVTKSMFLMSLRDTGNMPSQKYGICLNYPPDFKHFYFSCPSLFIISNLSHTVSYNYLNNMTFFLLPFFLSLFSPSIHHSNMNKAHAKMLQTRKGNQAFIFYSKSLSFGIKIQRNSIQDKM